MFVSRIYFKVGCDSWVTNCSILEPSFSQQTMSGLLFYLTSVERTKLYTVVNFQIFQNHLIPALQITCTYMKPCGELEMPQKIF